jgi:hypothetical protein
VTAPARDVAVRPRALACSSCGAGITLQAEGWAVTVACGSCGAVLDALDPNLRVLQGHALRLKETPSIPLGTRGTIHGHAYAVIGFQRVTITVEGVDYAWSEYVCFNPYHGFRYLSEYQGHWNVIEKLRRTTLEGGASQSQVTLGTRTYRHFQSALARTTFALGEFPWELRVGDRVSVHDYTSPPFLLSAESYEHEVTWSRGRYTPPAEIARMFALPALDRPAIGVYVNQPNPHLRGARRIGRTFAAFTALLVAMYVLALTLMANDRVLTERGTFVRAAPDANAAVFGPFTLDGRPSSVRLGVRADVSNDWLWFSLALIDEATGQARDVGVQTSYYFGTDSDGSWSEGAQRASVMLGGVPAGRYLLRVAPEGDAATGAARVGYEVTVDRDVPRPLWFLLGWLALLVPMLVAWWAVIGFENRRWLESDHEASVLHLSPEGDTP